MGKNLRYLQHANRAKIESDLVLTRIGELSIRDIDALARGALYEGTGKDAVILEGLMATAAGGMDVSVSVPAAAMQIIDGNDVRYCLDFNDGSNFSITLSNSDPSNDRIDIIEARVTKSSALQDALVDIIDPVTKSVTPTSKYRDYEIHFELQKKDGTPAGSPAPPSTTAATAGSITGTVTISGTIDLSSQYLLNLTIGTDGEFTEIDCRGSTPSATTLTEIINAINAAGFGSIASNDGSDHLKITAPGTGENSIIKIRPPADTSKDAYAEILGGTESTAYYDIFQGENKWFKIAEIAVGAAVSSVTDTDILDRTECAQWAAESTSIVDGKTLEGHRDAAILDHPDGSIYYKHLNQNAIDGLGVNLEDLERDHDRTVKRLGLAELKMLEQEIAISYLQQKQFTSSKMLVEAFLNEEQTADFETDSNTPAEVMDDIIFNNNWKQRDTNPDFKNGFLRPQKQHFMLEIVDEFNLEGVGQLHKGSISQYDATNDCYWLMTSAGGNAIGEIVKLSKHMRDGLVEIQAKYYIPAGGASNAWFGIDSDGSYLYFVLYGGAGLTSSKVYSLKINSDGTLGEAGYEKKSGEFIDLSDSIKDVHSIANSGDDTGYYNDVISWDSNDIMVLVCNGTTNVNLISLAKSNLGSGTANNITGLEKYVGGSVSYGRYIAKNNDDLWVRVNDSTDDYRWIFKIDISNDIVSDEVIKVSGRFRLSRNEDDHTGCGGGVTVSAEGDILEITNTSTVGQFISRRALKNALWAENQVNGQVDLGTTLEGNLSNTNACEVESDRYYWTGDSNVTANQADVLRFDIETGSYKHAVLAGASWTGIVDLATDGTTLWLLGSDGTNYEVYYGSLSSFVSQMETDTWTAPGGAADIDITSWGTLASGIGAASTDFLSAICHDSDNSILYIANDTDDKIDTLSEDGATWNQGVIDLPASTNNWAGIAYKNGKIFVGDYTGNTTPGKIFVLDIERSTGTAWHRIHIYQDPCTVFAVNGRVRMSFHGNDLVTIRRATENFIRMKTLEDDDVLQLHTFMDASNILLSNVVSCSTPIVERYFDDPDDYADIRNMPDKNYCAVGYGDNGFSVLHLDEYFADRTSTGKHRYDVRKIRVQHVKKAVNNLMNHTENLTAYSICIEKEIIIVGTKFSGGTGIARTVIVDLKSASNSISLNSAGSLNYLGSWTERNDAKGFSSNYNAELATSVSSASTSFNYFLFARTFTKEDPSDYKGENPKTFVLLGTDGGGDLLVFDWDSNNNRTLTKVWNVLRSDSSYYKFNGWIAPSGYCFAIDSSAGGTIQQNNLHVWEIDSDNGALNNAIVTISGLYMWGLDIAPNSRCWKLPSGEWRHQLLVGGWDTSATADYDYGMALVDIESETIEWIWEADTTTIDTDDAMCQVDLFEDVVFGIRALSLSGTALGGYVFCFKKLYFDDLGGTSNKNNWAYYGEYGIFDSSYRPVFTTFTYNVTGYSNTCRYSENCGVLVLGSSVGGLQFIHFHEEDESIHESSELNCDNPEVYNYTQTAILPVGRELVVVPYSDSDITYTNGATATWGVSGDVKRIARDSVTEGYLEWENIEGKSWVGVHFMKDDDSGGAKITVTDITNNQVLSDWNGVEINLYHAESSVEDDYVCWIDLPDSTHVYKVKVEHSGLDNAGANDYLNIKQFFEIIQVNAAEAQVRLSLRHTDHASTHIFDDINVNAATDIEKTQTFTANGTDTEFTLSGDNRAYMPKLFGKAALQPALTLANSLKIKYNAHCADTGDHTNGADSTNTVSAGPASNLSELIALVTEMLTDYAAHEDDAELGVGWSYHAAKEASDHSLITTTAPTNLLECIERLIDLKAKYNAHDADSTCHGVGNQHQESNSDPDVTWYSIGSVDLSWGTNSPNYDNETVDSNGYLTVKFDTAPDPGYAYIKYTPKANKYKIITKLKHPGDGATFKELHKNVRLLDHAIEVV